MFEDEDSEWFLVINIVGAVVCVGFVALISMMFLGFLTLDVLDLQIKARAAVDLEERKYAEVLLPIAQQHHRLLVTLLLLNAIAYESLPLFLDNLIPSWAAILMSVTFLLIFGELIPSAIFIGPNQLRLASYLAPLVNFFMVVLIPIALPLVKLLDLLVPPQDEESDTYHRGELSALIKIQHEEREAKRARAAGIGRRGTEVTRPQEQDDRSWKAFKEEIMEVAREKSRSRSNSIASSNDEIEHSVTPPPPLHQTEIKVVEGALKLKTKIALDVYTTIRNIFAIPYTMKLTKENITKIYAQGYSRVPVYVPDPDYPKRKNAVMGFLLIRQLIMIEWDDEREVSTVPLQTPPCVSPKMNLVDLLHLLQRGGSLMAFVCARPDVGRRAMEEGKPVPSEAGFMGIATLQDVIESVLQDPIYDEEDATDRALASATLTQWAATVLQRFVKKKAIKRGSARGSSPLKQPPSTDKETRPSTTDEETGPLLSSTRNGLQYT